MLHFESSAYLSRIFYSMHLSAKDGLAGQINNSFIASSSVMVSFSSTLVLMSIAATPSFYRKRLLYV